jgi:hypothetical protein
MELRVVKAGKLSGEKLLSGFMSAEKEGVGVWEGLHIAGPILLEFL